MEDELRLQALEADYQDTVARLEIRISEADTQSQMKVTAVTHLRYGARLHGVSKSLIIAANIRQLPARRGEHAGLEVHVCSISNLKQQRHEQDDAEIRHVDRVRQLRRKRSGLQLPWSTSGAMLRRP